jgi:DNA-binding transcriptional ArsR family regulator
MYMRTDDLSRTFAALADPTRRAILARLAGGQATVNELAEPFHLTQPSISKHLKVLEQAGLVSRGRSAQTRPCTLEPAPLRRLAQWVEAYRELWEDSFDRLDAFLQSTDPGPAAAEVPAAPAPSSTEGKPHVRKKRPTP